MKKKYYIIFLLLALGASSVVFVTFLGRRALNAEEKVSAPQDFITQQLISEIKDIKERIVAFKTVSENIKKIFNNTSYQQTTQIKLLTTKDDGLIFDFGYPSHGNLDDGFKGFDSTLVFKGIPPFLLSALKETLIVLGFSALLKITPAQEWLMKMIMLIHDRVRKRIEKSDLIYQATLLFSRLLKTPGYESLTAVFTSVSPLFGRIVDSIVFNGKPALPFLNAYYTLLREILNRQFSKTVVVEKSGAGGRVGKLVDNSRYKPNSSPLNDGQARSVLCALFIQSMLMYSQLCDAFDTTLAGEAARTKFLSVSSVQGRLEYNKVLPSFDELKAFIVIELARILLRLENKAYVTTLSAVFDPLLAIFGFNLSTLLTLANDAKPPAEQAASVPEPVYGDFSFTEFDVQSF